MMKKFTAIGLVVLVLVVYHYRGALVSKYISPCGSPLTYQVTAVDSRFNISQAKFKQAIQDAAQIWDKAAGRQLFAYNDNGDMGISLVYDDRQAATDKLKKLNLNLDSTQSSYNKLAATYKQYLSQYNLDKQRYIAAEQRFEADKRSHVPREQLNAEVQALDEQGAALNQEVDTLNAMVANLNRIGGELNLDVSSYNSTSQNLSDFVEGDFTVNGIDKAVTIYQFDNYNMLVRVLAHELGHSLGMEHVDDPKAIMYKQNQSTNEVPTADDARELNRVCKFTGKTDF